MTPIMKMTFVSATESKCSYQVSPQTCRQESPTCMVIIICTLVPGVSRKGSMACPAIPFNPITCHLPPHSCTCTLFPGHSQILSRSKSGSGLGTRLHLLIVHLLCNCKHSLSFSSFCGPTLSPNSYSCGFHTLLSSIIWTHCRTHKHMQFLCQYIASITWVSGVKCLFLRSFGNHNGNKVSFSIKRVYWSDTLLQCPELLAGCRSSATVLMATTTQINEICTPRNLFPMVRVAYTLEVQ